MKKVLVANRGEIAVRVMHACRELGLQTVAVYSEADENALFAKFADEAVCIGPSLASMSYLVMDKIIDAAKETGADAIHPGYGFLAENEVFIARCAKEGIKFIGPLAKSVEAMGNKVAARDLMSKAGVPTVPGSEDCVTDPAEAKKLADAIGYPILIKPAGGGGGKGMSIVRSEKDLKGALAEAQAVAASAFGLADCYIEKYLDNPRHIEIQILGDSKGNVIHLGERECSIQRRYQKVIEESPSPVITPEMRKKMGDVAVRAGKAVDYEGAGTIEFLYSNGDFYFMEMNTRVQVEHPVTEEVTGIDIVKEGIKIAMGEPLSIKQEDVRWTGWAIECRINAEDVLNDYAPAPDKIRQYRAPGGVGVRVDSGVYAGYTIPSFYDSMIAKLITKGRDRNEAIARMRRALYEFVIIGCQTNIPFQQAVMENARFVSGNISTHFIAEETTLMDSMKSFLEDPSKSIQTKLPFTDKKRLAAIAAIAHMS